MCQTAVARPIPSGRTVFVTSQRTTLKLPMSSSYTCCGKLAWKRRTRPSGPSIAARCAGWRPVGGSERIGPCRLLCVDAAALLVVDGERARGVVHQPLDSHQDVGAAPGQKGRALWDLTA